MTNVGTPTALLTGASRGIGEGVVRALRTRGSDVHAVALDDDDLRRVAGETGAIAHGLDICDGATLEAVIAEVPFDVAIRPHGRPDWARQLRHLPDRAGLELASRSFDADAQVSSSRPSTVVASQVATGIRSAVPNPRTVAVSQGIVDARAIRSRLAW